MREKGGVNMEAVEKQGVSEFIDGLGQLVDFWGFNKTIGWIFGMLYLREEPVSLEEIADELVISKGNVSINIREAERLGMVKKVWVKGDRKDYYEAEPNLWRVVRQVTRERQKREYSFAIDNVEQALTALKEADAGKSFAAKRLRAMSSFLKSVNGLVSGFLALETLKGAAVQACPVRSRMPKLSDK
jgi:DNA-binding transcriptional regulator GbsR (MarR family)